MDIRTEDYEKLGRFYLGRTYDIDEKKVEDDLLLYDSKDLVTHGCVLGMTGSGKTGLCIAMLEEAAMDNIPAIVIDPKGDIANILLAFPDLAPADFRPWINEDDAAKKGITPDEFAAKQADLWKNGLGEWGQTGERIRQFRDKVDVAVYTPGSKAGLPVSILSSLDCPEFEVVDDAEMLSERCETTSSSLLALVDEDGDPMSPGAVLLTSILAHCWRDGQDISLESLIRHVQVPPFDKIGVMDLETVFPEKSRFGLAMKLNNLLASPGFATWLEGEPLDIKRMMHTPEGKPRISIFSIAHLGDQERMFFVALLLNQMLGWMRAQSGTSSLRAMLYMDEIYGYLPPTANPPSKKPIMTMLKQARAFGLGVLLATQNPVDLDYKALSNMGTWFIGRLQTERDKMRVLDGLEGAASEGGGKFDRQAMEQLLAGLGSRVFLMNNVHEDRPVTFHVRWVMSYLRGPLARRQIKTLMDPRRELAAGWASLAADATSSAVGHAAVPVSAVAPTPAAPERNTTRPKLPRGAVEFFLPGDPGVDGSEINYVPAILRSAEADYSDPKKGVKGTKTITLFNHIGEDGEVDWNTDHALPKGLRITGLAPTPIPGAAFSDLPAFVFESKTWTGIKKEFIDWVYGNDSLTVLKSDLTDMYSAFGESEADFRARLLHAGREARDEAIEELREKFEKKMESVEDKIQRAQHDLEDQKSQARTAKLDTVMRIGGTILGAVLGRRSGSRSRSSLTGASRAWKEGRDVSRAEDKMEDLEDDLREMEEEARAAIRDLEERMDPMNEQFEQIHLTPYKKNVSADQVGILWLPYRQQTRPTLGAAW